MQLQRTAGNKAVQRLIKSRALQAKLKISQPNDIYEQEADRVSEQVMRMPDPVFQRKCAKCDKDGKKVLQAKESLGKVPVTQDQDLPLIIHEVLRSPGQPLDHDSRAFMEPRFGHDFSGVRVHTGARAAEASKGVNARAFTVREDVIFKMGEYIPEMIRSRQLLAHELAHVIQQRDGKHNIIQRQKTVGEVVKVDTEKATKVEEEVVTALKTKIVALDFKKFWLSIEKQIKSPA